MKKRALALFLALLMVCLAGCGVVQNEPTNNPAPSGSAGGADDSAVTASGDAQSQALAGADITLKLSHTDNDTSMLSNTWNCYARTFKSNLETYSGGTMTVAIYPNSQLGDETSCLEQCSQGTIDMVVGAAPGNLATWVPNFNVFDIPYLMENLDAVNMTCQGGVLQDLNADLVSSGNMRVLSLMATAYRNVDSWKAPVRTVGDMSGLKFRCQSIEAHTIMVREWGAVPTTVAFNELYSAASTGVIDVFEQANYGLFMNNLYETVKYVTETKHLVNCCMSVISDKTFSGLTAEQQSWIISAANDARRAALGVVTANNVNVTAQLREAGIEVISLSAEELAAFKDACYDVCVDTVLQNVDAEFYQKFLSAYNSAEEYLGLA